MSVTYLQPPPPPPISIFVFDLNKKRRTNSEASETNLYKLLTLRHFVNKTMILLDYKILFGRRRRGSDAWMWIWTTMQHGVNTVFAER